MRRYISKLNRFAIPLVVAVALFLSFVSPLTASAAWDDPFDYTTLPYAVELGADYNYVFFGYDSRHCFWTICEASAPNTIVKQFLNTGVCDFVFKAGVRYIIRCYPYGRNGLVLDHIPNGTDIGISASFTVDAGDASTEFDGVPSVDIYGWYKNLNNKSSSREEFGSFTLSNLSDSFSVVMPIDSEQLFSKVAEDDSILYNRFIPMISLNGFVASYSADRNVRLIFDPSNLVMKVPSSYWVQFQNKMLDSKLEASKDEILDQFISLDQEFDLVTSRQDAILTEIQKGFSSAQSLQWAHFELLQFDINKNGELVTDKIDSSAASVNNNIDLSKVEILNAIADMNNSIVTGTPEMDNIAQDSNQNLSNSSNKLDSLGDKLAAVEKPNVEDIQPSAPQDIVTDPNAGVLLSAPITSMWENKVIFGIVSTVLTLVLLSWVFFGKK